MRPHTRHASCYTGAPVSVIHYLQLNVDSWSVRQQLCIRKLYQLGHGGPSWPLGAASAALRPEGAKYAPAAMRCLQYHFLRSTAPPQAEIAHPNTKVPTPACSLSRGLLSLSVCDLSEVPTTHMSMSVSMSRPAPRLRLVACVPSQTT